MNEWLDDTIETILQGSHLPLDVLELGTGSGMILFNLIEHLQSYHGLELSQAAVDFVTRTANSMPDLVGKVRIQQGTAAELDVSSIQSSPTVVIVNSVAQYFPSQEYLLQVISKLLQLPSVRQLFFGDIRSYALYDEFLIRQALCKLGDQASKEEFRQRIAEAAQRELELLADPAFFTALAGRFPDFIEHVEILPKKMNSTNELSCFRYTAVVHVKERSHGMPRRKIREVGEDQWLDFGRAGLTKDALSEHLEQGPEVLCVSNIPYSKIILERHLRDSLHNSTKHNTSSTSSKDWFSAARQEANTSPALSPLDLIELAQQSGYRAELSWARQSSQHGGLDAIFHRHHQPEGNKRVLFRFPSDHQGRAISTLTSHPTQLQTHQTVREQLFEELQSKLPIHLVPEQINILEDFPINSVGAVDRCALARR